MMTTPEPDEETKKIYLKIMQSLEPDQIVAILSSQCGLSYVINTFILENFPVAKIPREVSYSILMSMHYLKILKLIIEGYDEFIDFRHMPIEQSTKHTYLVGGNIEEKFAHAVKSFYETLREGDKL